MKKNMFTKDQHGFVILFAVLISAIILLIGTGILGITVKETILASTARESQLAINAADTGVECVLYNEFITPGQPMNCLNDVFPAGLATFDFEINNTGGVDTCATTEVSRGPADPLLNPPAGYEEVKVISRGFNVCNGSNADLSDPLLLERVYRVKYFAAPVISQSP
ncbi:MAG: hypothetical protein KBC22_02100 [Candidatus Pacebacteria bacterium]|nr:hypothetical protein [Candidatus Paceibacterota bacterium]